MENYQLFLTARQTTSIRNAIANNNISTNMKLSRPGDLLVFGQQIQEKRFKNVAIPLARNNLPELVSCLTSSGINQFDRKISGKGAVRAGKRFTLFISNEDMNDSLKNIK